jgi:hypothetical protein
MTNWRGPMGKRKALLAGAHSLLVIVYQCTGPESDGRETGSRLT